MSSSPLPDTASSLIVGICRRLLAEYVFLAYLWVVFGAWLISGAGLHGQASGGGEPTILPFLQETISFTFSSSLLVFLPSFSFFLSLSLSFYFSLIILNTMFLPCVSSEEGDVPPERYMSYQRIYQVLLEGGPSGTRTRRRSGSFHASVGTIQRVLNSNDLPTQTQMASYSDSDGFSKRSASFKPF